MLSAADNVHTDNIGYLGHNKYFSGREAGDADPPIYIDMRP